MGGHRARSRNGRVNVRTLRHPGLLARPLLVPVLISTGLDTIRHPEADVATAGGHRAQQVGARAAELMQRAPLPRRRRRPRP
jgi:hypothetical protein